MEIGVAQQLVTPGGTITFNAVAEADGYLLTDVIGADAASIRSPVQPKAQTHGSIVHRFVRGPKYVTLTGLLVAATPASRRSLASSLVTALASIIPDGTTNTRGRYIWSPPDKSQRFHYVHLYEPPDVVGPGMGAGGSPEGIAGPKTFSFTLVSERPYAWTYNETYQALGVEIVNNGNARSFPIFRVPGGSDFSLANGEGFSVDWIAANALGSGTYVEIDMLQQTMRWDGTGASALAGLDMARSDFWAVPPGGTPVFGPSGTTYLSPDAWAG